VITVILILHHGAYLQVPDLFFRLRCRHTCGKSPSYTGGMRFADSTGPAEDNDAFGRLVYLCFSYSLLMKGRVGLSF
jgi:hypothetical protein